MANIPHSDKYKKSSDSRTRASDRTHYSNAGFKRSDSYTPASDTANDSHTGLWLMLGIGLLAILVFFPKLLIYGLIGAGIMAIIPFINWTTITWLVLILAAMIIIPLIPKILVFLGYAVMVLAILGLVMAL